MKQHIVITRPTHQAGALSQGIEAAGGKVFLFPTLEIKPSQLSQENNEQIQHLNNIDIIIFISPNAIEHGLNHILAQTKLPENILLATIGQGSASCLKSKLGTLPDICPTENFNSEGLLATKELQDINDKRILIIRGDSGREHLKQTLEQRGAKVEYFNAYQCLKPSTTASEFEQYLQNNQIAVIVITSVRGLKNLVDMVANTSRELLLQRPLLLINQRLVDIAKELGFKNQLFIAKQASDDALIESLQKNNLLS